MENLKEKVSELEKELLSFERLYDTSDLYEIQIDKSEKLLKKHEGLARNLNVHYGHWSYESEQDTQLSYLWDQVYELYKSRILEFKAILAFARDEPVKAREYVSLARQSLPKDKYLVSGLGKSYLRTITPQKAQSEFLKPSNLMIIAVIILIIILFIRSSDNTDPIPDDGRMDYCDSFICK